MRTHLHHMLRERSEHAPGSPALTYRDRTLGHGELWEAARAVATGLVGLGVGREDRVAIFLEKRLETVAAIHGTSAAGGAFVPVNPVLRPPQVAHILEDSGAAVLITSAQRFAQLDAALLAWPAPLEHVVLLDAVEPARAHRSLRVHPWSAVVEHTGAVRDAGTDHDLAAVLYTSGSTGRPKGVALSHRNLLVGAESVSSYLDNRADDVILAALPLSFDAGLSQLTTACSVGAHVVLVNYLLPRDIPRLCARHGVTGLTCVPPLWIQIADQEWPAEATARMRYFANTGGRMPQHTLARLREIFPTAAPYLMYGLTEAFRSTYLDPTEVDLRPGSIGKAIPNAEVVVVGPDGIPCAPGEEGELVHLGPLVALGYWNDPERTAERFRPAPGRTDRWRAPERAVWSGDRVVTDEEGFLYFVGRTDELIKTSGYRVSPTEIEEAAYGTGLVRDAVALGIEDPGLGQRIVVVAAPVNGAELDPGAVLDAMRPLVPGFMLPAQVVARHELPRSPNGKFDRVLLRQELEP